MAVSLYFGLPGCGKTTTLAMLAYKAVADPKRKYLNVYSNVLLNIPGVTFIDNSVIGKYELRDCLLLIDEATLFADSRDFKNFDKGRLEYFLEHRHRNADIILFTQQWDGVDRKIRTITDRVYYVYKGFFTGWFLSSCVKIPYGILFPDPKRSGEALGEIVQGYSKPPFLARLFATRIFRPRWYKYYDSWDLKPLSDLPRSYAPVMGNVDTEHLFRAWRTKMLILLRSSRKYRKKAKRSGYLPSSVEAMQIRRESRIRATPFYAAWCYAGDLWQDILSEFRTV